MFKTTRVLDTDNSGTISLDEFLEFFGSAWSGEGEKNVEDELEDEIWPEWIIKQSKLPYAQTLFAKMFAVLELENSISAE